MSSPLPSHVLYEKLFLQLPGANRHGTYFEALCPFHDEQKPSFLVYPDGAYCMGCHRRATLHQVWKRVLGRPTHVDREPSPILNWSTLPHPEALAEEAYQMLRSFPDLGLYLRQRGLAERIEQNQLGWYAGWYTIPGFSDAGRFLGLILRAGPQLQSRTQNRYLTPPDQAPFLYIPDWRRVRQSRRVFVTFGVLDALALAEMGFPVVSPTNGTHVSGEALEALGKSLVLLPDSYPPEEADQVRRLASTLGWKGKTACLRYPNGGKDAADCVTPGARRSLISQLARL